MSDYETIQICKCGKPLFIVMDNGSLYCPTCKLVPRTCDKHKIPMNYNPFDSSFICLKCNMDLIKSKLDKTPFGSD